MSAEDAVACRLARALTECETHWSRLDAASQEARGFGPIDTARYQRLTEAEIKTLDQVLFRFAKLQDAMGTRLFPAVLQLLGEWQEDEPFIDRLRGCEKNYCAVRLRRCAVLKILTYFVYVPVPALRAPGTRAARDGFLTTS